MVHSSWNVKVLTEKKENKNFNTINWISTFRIVTNTIQFQHISVCILLGISLLPGHGGLQAEESQRQGDTGEEGDERDEGEGDTGEKKGEEVGEHEALEKKDSKESSQTTKGLSHGKVQMSRIFPQPSEKCV